MTSEQEVTLALIEGGLSDVLIQRAWNEHVRHLFDTDDGIATDGTESFACAATRAMLMSAIRAALAAQPSKEQL